MSSRWFRQRGSRRSGSAACRAAAPAAASAPGRASSPAPRGGAGSLRRGRLSAQFLELRPVGGELVPLRVHHVGRRLGDEALVGEPALPPLPLRAELLPPLRDAGTHG